MQDTNVKKREFQSPELESEGSDRLRFSSHEGRDSGTEGKTLPPFQKFPFLNLRLDARCHQQSIIIT